MFSLKTGLFRQLILLSGIFLLAACQNPSLEKLRSTAPKGSAYQNALAAHYLRYAEVREQDGNYKTATRFADKGLSAAYGNDVLPDEIPELAEQLGKEERSELAEARAELLSLLSDETKQGQPETSAAAVFFFDCWLDQSIAGAVNEDIEFCKLQSEASVADLRAAQAAEIAEESVAEEEVTSTAAEIIKPMERYVVYFALDEFILDESAKRTIEALFAELGKGVQYNISVNGHTDTSGSDRYNMMLSNQRAEAVKAMLSALGVDENRISTFGFGETDLAIPTDDETYEPKNRRAEIVVN